MSLVDSLAEMSKDPAKQEAYRDHPEDEMDKAGLSEEDREVLRSGDRDTITAHLGDDAPPGCLVFPFI